MVIIKYLGRRTKMKENIKLYPYNTMKFLILSFRC